MDEELKKFFEPWELKVLELIEDLKKDNESKNIDEKEKNNQKGDI